MKTLLITACITGHNITYIRAIDEACDHLSIVAVPEEVGTLNGKQYIYSNHVELKNDLRTVQSWLHEFASLARKENISIIHFTEGDRLLRYFGLGLGQFKKSKIIFTLHHFQDSFLRRLSLRLISSQVDAIVVHPDYIFRQLKSIGIKNVVHIEYPQFNIQKYNDIEAKAEYCLDLGIPVLGCLGATRNAKGLDLLLKALNKVTQPFQLLIAGKPAAFDEKYIRENSKKYASSVHCVMKFISEEEFAKSLCATDIICLPYRRSFNGASGPLGEGVALRKCIVGPNHGTLGETITRNHLGYTFETENIDSLAEAISKALSQSFVPDDTYLKYQESLNPDFFVRKYRKLYESL